MTESKHRRLTPQEVERVKVMIPFMFATEIAGELKVTEKTISRIKKKFGIKCEVKHKRQPFHTKAEQYEKERILRHARCTTHTKEDEFFQNIRFSITCPDCGMILASEMNRNFLEKFLEYKKSKKNIIEQTI